MHELNQNIQTGKVLILDAIKQQCRVETVDRRDIDRLLLDNNLPEMQRANLSETQIMLRGSRQDLVLKGNDLLVKSDNVNDTRDFVSRCGITSGMISPLIYDESLHGIVKMQLQEAQWQGKPVLEITIDRNSSKVSILADPELDYRFFRVIRVYVGNVLKKEVIAGDYRTVNGIPFPFSQSDTQFAPNGEIVHQQTIQCDDVRINVDIPSDSLTLDVPAGTRFHDMIKYASGKIPGAMKVSLDDIESIGLVALAARDQDLVLSSPEVVARNVEILSQRNQCTSKPHLSCATRPVAEHGKAKMVMTAEATSSPRWKVLVGILLGVVSLLLVLVFFFKPRLY